MSLPDNPEAEARQEKSKQNLLKPLILSVGIAFAFWMSLQPLTLPNEIAATAKPTVFSAARTIQHLEHIAVSPRAVGLPGHTQAREYILAELREMGLTPEVQETTSLLRFPGAPGFSAGRVKNILVRIPGINSSGAIALDAHYDGASTGPAAADCGSGVAILLESIRVVLAGPALKNDLIFVFADAEEMGDLGAHAFASQHPWMHDVRVALNYEAMGTGGPAYLYATSKGNHPIIKAYSKASCSASANSFIVGIFNLVPEQRLACDLQDYMDEGSAGYGFVFTGNISAYHTILDNIESLDLRTVQQLGETTLALLGHLGNTGLNDLQSDTEEVFFTIWPQKLIHYPASWSLPMAVLGLILLLLVIGLHVQSRRLSLKEVIMSVVFFLAGIIMAVILAAGVWYGLKWLISGLNAFLIGNWAIEWFYAGLLLFAATFMVWAVRWLRPRISIPHQLAAAFLVFSLLSLLLGVVYPVGSHLFLWPVLFGAPSLWVLLAKDRMRTNWPEVLAILFTVIPTIVLTVPLIIVDNPFVGLLIRLDALTGMPFLALGAFFPAILAGLLVPLFTILDHHDSRNNSDKLRMLSWVGIGTTLVLLTIGWATSGFDENHPHPESIRYELDVNQEKAQWVSGDYRLGEWTAQFIPPTGPDASSADHASILPFWPVTYAAPAPLTMLKPPSLKVLADTSYQATRTVHLRLSSPRMASLLSVRIEAPDTLIMAQLEGQLVDLSSYDIANSGVLQLNYVACPPEGIELLLRTIGTGPIRISLVDMKVGLPPGLEQAKWKRPLSTMPSPLGADCTVVRSEMEI